MNPYAVPPLVTSLLALSLGSFVLLKNTRAKTNIFFFLGTFAISLWLFTEFVLYSSRSSEEAFLWAKITYVPVIFLPIFLLQFSLSLLRISKFKKILSVSYFIGCILALSLLLTDYLISGVRLYPWGYYHTVGFLHYFLLVYYIFLLSLNFGVLYGHSKDIIRPVQERDKIKLVLLADLIVCQAWTDFLPKYGIAFYPVGFTFVSVWIFLVTYTIIRHRLFDIKVVVSRGTTYVFTIFLGILPGATIIYFLQKVFPLTIPIVLVVALAAALAVFFIKIHPFSEWFVQKKLFKTYTNYYEILRRFAQDMATATDLRDLLIRFDQTLHEAMQVTSVAVYLTGPSNGRYPLTHPLGKDSNLIAIVRNEQKPGSGAEGEQIESAIPAPHHSNVVPLWRSGDALVSLAYEAKDVLVLGEMEMMARERRNERLEQAIDQMKEAKAEVCVPFKRDGKMVGMALLGPREGDRYYNPDDLRLLHTLGQSACVAVQNCLMVEEIKRSYEIVHRMHRLAAMGTLIAGVSHEIRNPLMPLGFLIDMVGDTAKNDETLKQIHKHSSESIRRIISVLDEMDEFARPQKPVFGKADVNAVLDDALALLDAQIKLQKQEVIKDYAALPEIMVDEKRLRQAMWDIILNAIEANKPGGKIVISTREIQLKGIKGQPLMPGVQIEIKDTGCGIPPENIERVFDPFFTTKHESLLREGTGLGMAIVHKIIEEHGGSIEIRSEEGKGTSVFVNLMMER